MASTLTSVLGGASGVDPGSTLSGSTDDSKLKETADKFESLMIHNMLKAMRRTTMAESTSNGQAMYEDMLDEKFAAIMSESGKLGVSDAIVRQLKHSVKSEEPLTQNVLKLRELISGDQQHNSRITVSNMAIPGMNVADNDQSVAGLNVNDVHRLRFAAGLWNTGNTGPGAGRKQAFIHPLLPHAERTAERLGTSVNAVLAVAALETGWGRHVIENAKGEKSHNLFGIKAGHLDTNSTQSMTTEYVDGKKIRTSENFRVYDSPKAAVDGFADFLLENPRYATALSHADDPERFIAELQNAGYATDPQYANKVITVMHQIAKHRGDSGG
ncbi:MAG: flagellar assembly peptidoglycan hydrolase FlgJ [Granulosicoccus sp.]